MTRRLPSLPRGHTRACVPPVRSAGQPPWGRSGCWRGCRGTGRGGRGGGTRSGGLRRAASNRWTGVRLSDPRTPAPGIYPEDIPPETQNTRAGGPAAPAGGVGASQLRTRGWAPQGRRWGWAPRGKTPRVSWQGGGGSGGTTPRVSWQGSGGFARHIVEGQVPSAVRHTECVASCAAKKQE